MRQQLDGGGSDVEPPKRHEVYYKEGVVIRVENTLFKVPRSMLELNAPDLADLLPESTSSGEVGSSDELPVTLEDVTAIDFERLLVIVYPIITSEDYPSTEWKTEEWTSVLHLAARWNMAGIRSMALKNLEKVASPAAKIRLGRKYDHSKWLSDGFMNLCLRAEPLTLEEAQELELKDVVGCASARESIRAKVIALEAGTSMFNSSRLGNIRVRIGKYEDGLKYMSNPCVRDIVESTFEITTEKPAS